MEQAHQYLTIDIGGTAVKYSIFNSFYEELEGKEEATRKDPDQFLAQIFSIVERYQSRVEGIGVCMGGFIDPVTGDNHDFSVGENFRAWNLKKELSKISNLPVVLENDSNCAALGELVSGAGRDFSNFGLLTIGTGVGGALVWDGRLVRGSHFKAGEAGFVLTGKGSKEGYVNAEATSALVRRVSEAVGEKIDGFYIFEHLDESAVYDVYRQWLEKLAITAGNLAVLIDPDAVLIGGGICRQERFIKDLRSKIYELFPHLSEYTQILACSTGNLAGRIGALSLLLETKISGKERENDHGKRN